jgi:hypothetical protein
MRVQILRLCKPSNIVLPAKQLRRRSRTMILIGTLTLVIAACTGRDQHPMSVVGKNRAARATTANGSAAVTAATLTVADFDLYEQGIKARMDIVQQRGAAQVRQEVQRQLRPNVGRSGTYVQRRPTNTLLMMGADEADARISQGAGMTTRHMRDVMSTVGALVAYAGLAAEFDRESQSSPLPQSADTNRMSAAELARAREAYASRAREASQEAHSQLDALTVDMAPDVAVAFQERRDRLITLTYELMTVLNGS